MGMQFNLKNNSPSGDGLTNLELRPHDGPPPLQALNVAWVAIINSNKIIGAGIPG